MRAVIKIASFGLPVGLQVEVMHEIDDETVFIRTPQISKSIPKYDLTFLTPEGKPYDN